MKKRVFLILAVLFCLPAALFAADDAPYKLLDDSNFVAETKGRLVFVDFYADWCGPCRQFAPIFEAVAAANPDLFFVKVDTDASPKLSAAFKNSKVIAKFTSFPRNEKTFDSWVKKVVAAVEKQD